jgi:hypothetical protein
MAAAWTPKGTRSMQAVEALTEVAPVSTNEGVDLQDVWSIAPIVHAPAGQTFTGAGSLLGYVYISSTSMWVRFPRADYDLSELAGLQDAALPTFEVKSPRGRFALIANGVVLSGAGAEITIEFLCVTRQGLGRAE